MSIKHKYSYKTVSAFMKDYKKGLIAFPNKRLYYTENDIRKMFNELKSLSFEDRVVNKYFKIHNVKWNINRLIFLHKPVLLISKDDDHSRFGISDMFQENNRLKCKFFSAISSPMDYYYKNIKSLAEGVLKWRPTITPYALREELYFQVRECSAFKPANLVYVIKLLNVKSILDPSAGWGDRLIGAMATGVRYVGVDPNTALHPVYKEMIEFFMPPSTRNKYTMIESTIQDAILPNEKFDLVFTSPPYFKIEQYSNRGRVRDVDEHKWFDNFLKPMILKTVSKLNEGGYLVLVINQLPHEKYIYKMHEYIHLKTDLHAFGVIGYSDKKISNPQPMWIWKKSKKMPIEMYNPPVVVTKHKFKNIEFSVFRDDMLFGGTKIRGLMPMLKNVSEKEIIYAGPAEGMAQVALAYACHALRKTAVLFIQKRKRTKLTSLALSFKKSVKIYESRLNVDGLIQLATAYKNKNGGYLLSFGGYNKIYMSYLYKSLKFSLPNVSPARIWLVAGSATILNVLYKVFPKTEFHIVQVGRTIWDDQLDLGRTTKYVSQEKFGNIASEQPPYPTVATYDAKLWTFFKKNCKKGDYIWNVAKDVL